MATKPSPKPEPAGRYLTKHGIAVVRDGQPAPAPGGRIPPNGYGRPAPSRNVRTAIGTIPDPLERGKTLEAAVNRNVDILENEMSHGRISVAACVAGRKLKEAYERLPGPSGSNWRGGDRIDPIEARNLKEDMTLDALAAVRVVEHEALRVIGESGVNFLARILRDGLSFGELASRAEAKGSRADVAGVASHFRKLLEYLADGWSAKGPDR